MSDSPEDPTPSEGEPTDTVKVLRERGDKAEAKAAEAQAQLDALQRDLVFTKAGVPETGTGALLRKAYDGETTIEGVQAAMEEYQITGPAEAAPTVPTPTAQEILTPTAVAQGLAPVHPASVPGEGEAFIEQMNSTTSQGELIALLEKQGLVAESQGSHSLIPLPGLNQ